MDIDVSTGKKIMVLGIFAIAMGMLESAVVIYLREILYPGGFDFPLNPIRPDLVWTEILREVATLVMLITAGMLTGRSFTERFAWFLYAFAVWDIFYYIFLWVLIGWPESLLTWDVLFLLPVTWTGPVISPVIVSFTMILFAILILLSGNNSSGAATISRLSWILLISGSLLMITAFSWDYSGFVLDKMSFRDIWTLPQSQVHSMVHQYVPEKFNWMLFCVSEVIIFSGIYLFWKKNRKAG